MDQAVLDVVDEIVKRENWTHKDCLEIVQSFNGEIDAPEKFHRVLSDIESANPSASGAAALKIGMMRYSLNLLPEAMEILQAATDNPYKYYYIGLCYLGAKDAGAALKAFTKSQEMGMDTSLILIRIIETMMLAGDHEGARAQFSASSQKLESEADLLYLEGLFLEMENNYDGAIEKYLAAAEADDNQISAKFRLAYCLDLHGEDEDTVIEYYKSCIRVAPVHVGALFNLAVIYEDMGRNEEAETCLQTILSCNPNNWRAKLYMKDVLSSNDMYYDEDRAKRIATRCAIMDISISDFELSVRARNCLKKMNIFTLGDLVRTPESELLGYKNFGETSLKEIKAMLKAKNLCLGQDLDSEGNIKEFVPGGQSAKQENSEEDIGVRAISVDKVSLSVRSLRVLENLKIRTLGQLADKTETELACQKNFGKTSLVEIKEALNQYGLNFREL